MQASEIMMFEAINPVDQTHVEEIAESIRENGWIGAPILVIASHGMLVTGSHRLAALRQIDEAWDDDEWFDLDTLGDIAEPVDDIIEAWCAENSCTVYDIQYDRLGDIFAGTWVEKWKSEIVEW